MFSIFVIERFNYQPN
ncbi:TPA: erythromycin resistance leader peptide [Streptococcus pyogenes]